MNVTVGWIPELKPSRPWRAGERLGKLPSTGEFKS